MTETIVKIIKWIVFIPVIWLSLLLFKGTALLTQHWIKHQVHEASGWSYFVAETTFGWFWIPYLLLWLALNLMMNKLCPKPKIGAIILLTILVLGAMNFYFVSGKEVFISWVLSDITAFATLGILFMKEIEETITDPL
jgi:hypothetical protein